MSRLRALIAHPGATSLLFPLVAALQRIDPASDFHTSLYFNLDGGLGRALGALPAPWRERLRHEFGRRFRSDIAANRVHRHPMGEIAHLLCARLGPQSGTAAMRWRNDRFDGAIARTLQRTMPRNYIGFDGSALHSIRAARRLGVNSVLIQAIGHIDALIAILAEERKRWPAFFGAADLPPPPSWLERQRAEAREADIVAVASDYVAETLIARGTDPGRIRKIPYPCDTARFAAPSDRPQSAKLRALFVGAIGPRKGIPYLLEAAAPLVRGGSMSLDLVGPLDCPAEALAPWRDIFVHRAGLAPAAMAAVYRHADMLVFPSLHEGQAMVCNEALASGLPLICTANAGSTISEGKEGYLVPLRNSAAIRERLQSLIDDRQLLARMAHAARAHAEANDVTRFTDNLGKILVV